MEDYKEKYSNYFSNMVIRRNELIVLCPFHDDHNPSLHIKRDTGQYYCFSCKAKGNFKTFEKIINKDGVKQVTEVSKMYRQTSFTKYSLQEYANEKMLDKNYLKAQFGLYNDKSKLVIPYFDENNNLLYNKYRYANKNFSSDKNIELSLYGLQHLKYIQKCGYVILVEGESDVQTLMSIGMPTLGVPGCNNFKDSMLDHLKGLTIFIFKEKDDGGITFVKNVYETLRRGKDYHKVEVVFSKSEALKDPNEIYKHCIQNNKNFREEWKNIMQNTIRLSDVNMPVDFKEPYGYTVDTTGIYKFKQRGEGKGTKELICRTPIVLANRLINYDKGIEKITIYYFRDNTWKEKMVSRTTLFTSSGLLSLAEYGLTITSNNVTKVIKYLEDYEANQYNDLKRIRSVSQYGWHGKYFVPIASPGIIVDIEGEENKKDDYYKPVGKIEDWIKIMTIFKENDFFRFVMAGSFSAPLLKLIKCRSFLINLWTGTGSGKTATLKAALSVWGNPEKIMISFNSTTIGLERTVSYYTDLPIGIDEKQQAKGKQDMIDQWVYMLAGEIGKKRGTAKGLQQTMEWSTVGLTTAEEPLHGTQSHGGVLTRILDIYGKPFDKPEYAKQVHQNIGSCYGDAGKIYINKIIEEWYDKQDTLRSLHKDIVTRLSLDNDDKIASNIESVAVAILGDYLSNKYVFNVDNLSESIDFGRRIIEHLLTKKESDIIERAYEDISSWCIANYNFFNQNKFGENYGELIGDEFNIFIVKFNEIVKSLGYSPKQIRTGFKEKGYFYCTQESSRDGSSVRNVYGIKTKVFILKVSKNTNKEVDMEIDAIDIQKAQAEEYKIGTR